MTTEDRRKEFKELLAKRNANTSVLCAFKMAHLYSVEALNAKLDERAAILARLEQLRKEDPSLTDDNPDTYAAIADNMLFIRKHPFTSFAVRTAEKGADLGAKLGSFFGKLARAMFHRRKENA